MAHYDDDTKKFIEDVSKNTLSVARDISRKRLPESITKKIVGQATKHVMDKEGAINLHALRVYSELNNKFGSDWQNWEPETLWATTGYRTAEYQNLIMALQVICKTNFPFEEWSVFERVVHAVNGNDVHFNEIVPSELDHIAWAIKVLRTIRPEEEFSSEVCAYIKACAMNSGVLLLPENLFPKESSPDIFVELTPEIKDLQKAKLNEISNYVTEMSV